MREVHVFVEPDVDTPVWVDGEPVDPVDLGLDDETAEAVRTWARVAAIARSDVSAAPESAVDLMTGWMGQCSLAERYDAMGEWVARRVKDAVGDVPVILHPDPVHPGDRTRRQARVVPPLAERPVTAIRLMPEHGAGLPVWGEFVTLHGVGRLSPSTEARLRAWNETHEQRVDDEHSGSLDSEAARRHAAKGVALRDLVADELGPEYRVVLDD